MLFWISGSLSPSLLARTCASQPTQIRQIKIRDPSHLRQKNYWGYCNVMRKSHLLSHSYEARTKLKPNICNKNYWAVQRYHYMMPQPHLQSHSYEAQTQYTEQPQGFVSYICIRNHQIHTRYTLLCFC